MTDAQPSAGPNSEEQEESMIREAAIGKGRVNSLNHTHVFTPSSQPSVGCMSVCPKDNSYISMLRVLGSMA